ncbi:Ger(x)C family spore germination protein [Clostridium sp. JS66]|uniref:Ger(x)C family spore germination protein n=1 Tax=Clostridium sp. JS66 TaxID=3064705 RepID=UPI00298DFC86|nr:Ger(x)C family spore germination protein [Clostridium sp. JS66]WPC44370.1 Ger(x)C family spore germination protein [Clostridium sp. JS66]
MKKYINIGLKIIICILIALNLTSCWSAHEINKLAIVMGIGIDKGREQGYPVEMTVQLANVSGIKSSSKNKDGETSNAGYLNLKEKGKSISDAAKAFNRKLNRKLFFSHNQIIILGKDAAEGGIEKYVDFFLRYRETRLLTWVLVSKQPASEVLNIKPELETTPGRNIGELIKNEKDISQIPSVDLRDFASKLMSKTTSPIAPIIEVSRDNDKKIAYLSETAVFKKDKMIGTLNKQETRGLLWGINKMKDGVIVLNTSSDDKINIVTTHSKSRITPKIKDNKPSIKIEIKQEGDLQEQTFSEDLANPKAFEIIQKSEEEAIKKEIMLAVKKSQELNSDIFGFGDIIYQHYPKHWAKMEKEWDEVFRNMSVDVSVNAKLRRTGRITKPIMSKEE